MAGAERRSKLPTTVDEFFAWDGEEDGKKYELVDGRLRAMSPAAATHGVIQSNLAILIGNHIRSSGLPCIVVIEPPIVPKVQSRRNLRVPDLGVSCVKSADADLALADPMLLIEILSPSNQADTWNNVWAYTTIPSLREILIVESTRLAAKVLTRLDDATWPADTTSVSARGTMRLSSLDFEVPLREVYAGSRLAK